MNAPPYVLDEFRKRARTDPGAILRPPVHQRTQR